MCARRPSIKGFSIVPTLLPLLQTQRLVRFLNQDPIKMITPTVTTSSGSAPPPSTPDDPPTPSTPGAHLGDVIPPPHPTTFLEKTKF